MRRTVYGTLSSDDKLNENEKAMLYIKECAESVGIDVIEGETAFSITFMAEIMERLREKPKTGHWIEHPEIETSTPEYLMFYECSECGDKQCFYKLHIHKKRFCINCGCRMVEPQERSDKE